MSFQEFEPLDQEDDSVFAPEVVGEGKGKRAENGYSTDSVRVYLREIGRVPLMSHEEELTEARKVQRYLQLLEVSAERSLNAKEKQELEAGKRAKSHMIQANLRLVVAVAKKYQNRGLELMDLIQEGNFGLERAVEKFDPAKGFRFSTYAHWWIRQSITRGVLNQARTIRLPVHLMEKLNVLKKAQREFSQVHGRLVTVKELAAIVGQTPEEVRKLINWSAHPVSLEKKIGSDLDTDLGELLESGERSPEEIATVELLRDSIGEMLGELTDKERMVIETRFGLKGGDTSSLATIGEVLNVSRERVRQIEAKAMKKLRKAAAQAQVRDYLEAM